MRLPKLRDAAMLLQHTTMMLPASMVITSSTVIYAKASQSTYAVAASKNSSPALLPPASPSDPSVIYIIDSEYIKASRWRSPEEIMYTKNVVSRWINAPRTCTEELCAFLKRSLLRQAIVYSGHASHTNVYSVLPTEHTTSRMSLAKRVRLRKSSAPRSLSITR